MLLAEMPVLTLENNMRLGKERIDGIHRDLSDRLICVKGTQQFVAFETKEM